MNTYICLIPSIGSCPQTRRGSSVEHDGEPDTLTVWVSLMSVGTGRIGWSLRSGYMVRLDVGPTSSGRGADISRTRGRHSPLAWWGLPAGRWFDSEESRFVRICGASRGFTRAYRGLLLPPFLEQDVEADLGPRSIASVGQRDEPGQLAIGLTFRAGERDASLASSTGHRIARKGQAKFPRAGFRFPQAAPHPTEGRTNRWDFLVTPSRRVSR